MAHVSLSQSIVREFCRIISPQLSNRDPWTLTGPDRGKCTAILQARALPPLFTGGTFTCEHRQQHAAVSSVCERFVQNLVDSSLLSHGWRHWTSHWMREGAPDVLRFLMLSHALAAPGWVGREELVNIRGVPQGAQGTAHAVLDQLIQQGRLQEDSTNVRYVAVAGRMQHKQHHDHLQQQSGFSQSYHLQYQPAQNIVQQPTPAQDVVYEQQRRPGEYQPQVFSVQEHQPQYDGAAYIAQAQQQPQQQAWHDQHLQQQQQQPYQYAYEVQQPQNQSVQVVYINDSAVGQQEYKAAPDTSYLYAQQQQQQQQPGIYPDTVMYTVPGQQLAAQHHDTVYDARTGASNSLQGGWQAQYTGQAQQQQQQYMFPGPSQPQLIVEQGLVQAGPSSTGGHTHASMQPYNYIPVGGDSVPRAHDVGPYASGGHTWNVPAAPAAQQEHRQQQWQEQNEPSRGRPMKRAHNDRPAAAAAAYQSNGGSSSWRQSSRDRGPYIDEYGSTNRPARSNSPNKRLRTYQHPYGYGAQGPASDPPRRQQQQQQHAAHQPHRPGTSGREVLLGSSQPGYYQRHGSAAPTGPTGRGLHGPGAQPGSYERRDRGSAMPDRAPRGADRPQHPQQPAADRAWGEPGRRGNAAAAAAAAGESGSRGVHPGKQLSAGDQAGQPVKAATGTAAAAAAVMSGVAAGQQHTSTAPAAAAAAQLAKKKKGKKQGGKDAAVRDLLLISRRQRQQQRHEEAAARPLGPGALCRLVVAELCDAAPFAVKVELLRQLFPVNTGHKGPGSKRGKQAGRHGANQHQARDVASLLAHLHQQGYVEVFRSAAPAGTWYARWLDDDWASRLTSASDCDTAASDGMTAAAKTAAGNSRQAADPPVPLIVKDAAVTSPCEQAAKPAP